MLMDFESPPESIKKQRTETLLSSVYTRGVIHSNPVSRSQKFQNSRQLGFWGFFTCKKEDYVDVKSEGVIYAKARRHLQERIYKDITRSRLDIVIYSYLR